MFAAKLFSLPKSRLAIAGRLFCVFSFLIVSACDRNRTPDWDQPGGSKPATVSVEEKPAAAATSPAESQREAEVVSEPKPVAAVAVAAEGPSTSGLRFIAYNVKNWLTMDRYVDRKALKGAPKPDAEKEAVIAILVRHAPDVVGLCEIGTAEDLAEIQELLKKSGLDLPHSHYTSGSDPTRRLGLLSRFPIASTARPEESEYRIHGKLYAINRGISDVKIEARGNSYRFVGVHLKSKREVEEGDEEEMRRAEARLLRQHVDEIFDQNPDERLIVYGDFNDTRPSVSGKMIFGSYNDPKYLTAIPFFDSVGTSWTYHWSLHDIYSRIDFVAVSNALKSETDFENSRIIDDADSKIASDHRPVMAIFR